jgi:uncharacterized membrane-anchored protein YjiN (DUF445 family)
VVSYTVTIQLLHTILLSENQNEESRCSVKMWARYVNRFSDDRVQHYITQIIHLKMMSKSIQAASMTVAIYQYLYSWDQNLFSEVTDLKQMWVNAEIRDESYKKLCQAIQKQQRSFLTVLKVRIFIMKCFLSDEKSYSFTKDTECCLRTLCTELIQYTHDSTMTEHLERNVTDVLLLWQFFDSRCYRMSVHSVRIVTNAVWTTAEKMSTRLLEAFTCTEANLIKDIHWLCSRFTVKWELYKPSDNYELS